VTSDALCGSFDYVLTHLVTRNEGHVSNIDEVGVVGVKKKQSMFHKKKQNSCDFEGATSRIEKGFVQGVCVKFEHVDGLWDELLSTFPL
jgi:hypothetical protein